MPIKATAALWGSLLCACKWHKNVDFRERVAECIFVLNPKDATPYVLLSNIYAAVGRWSDIQEVRRMMKVEALRRHQDAVWLRSISRSMFSLLEIDPIHKCRKAMQSWRGCLAKWRQQGMFLILDLCWMMWLKTRKNKLFATIVKKIANAFGLLIHLLEQLFELSKISEFVVIATLRPSLYPNFFCRQPFQGMPIIAMISKMRSSLVEIIRNGNWN